MLLSILQLSYCPEPGCYIRDKVKVLLDLPYYANKRDLEHETGVNSSDLASKKDFIALKVEVDKQTSINWLMFQLARIILKQRFLI